MSPKGYTAPRTYLRRPEDLGGLIKSQRERLTLSQQELADRLGVSRKWINEIEQGNAGAKLGLVLRALNELEIEIVAETGSAKAEQPLPPIDEIDIDAIADMNLGSTRGPTASRGRRK